MRFADDSHSDTFSLLPTCSNVLIYLRCTVFLISACICTPCFAGHLYPEKWYQERWCHEQQGQLEYILSDKTRCDCVTREHAVEFDFGVKWAEAIGQALHYAAHTGKQAGIVLILERKKDCKYLIRLNSVIQYYKLPIDVWTIRPPFLEIHPAIRLH